MSVNKVTNKGKQEKTEKNTGKHRKTGETIENKKRKTGNNMNIQKTWETWKSMGKQEKTVENIGK